MQEEIWKDIPGFEGYQASNLGRVKSKHRQVVDKNGNTRIHQERILKPSITRKGYLKVYPTIKCKKYSPSVHKLIALTFIGERKPGHQINHINCDKTDNSVENLEYCTQSENQKHAFKNGLNSNKGSKSATSIINEEVARNIKILKSEGHSLKDISLCLDVSYHIVKDISRGRTWNHVKI